VNWQKLHRWEGRHGVVVTTLDVRTDMITFTTGTTHVTSARRDSYLLQPVNHARPTASYQPCSSVSDRWVIHMPAVIARSRINHWPIFTAYSCIYTTRWSLGSKQDHLLISECGVPAPKMSASPTPR